ncbi:Gp49 family protein [Lysobacter capsici]|uniref:Gp49 family protein n=1 Tax=Lysobacter capsici TaxID=435897 RepID=UPI001C003812|nr:Gp49 family protein [Lysobacter capsici]QWF19262.1 hypothetical protein KME82_11245 [Lysobacter capsici]
MTDQQIEDDIQAKGLTAPRVTPDDVQAAIVGAVCFTAAEGVKGHWIENGIKAGAPGDKPDGPLNLLTFCVLTLSNGFTVTGESACASPENFDAEIGRKIARQNAEAKVWPLLGFRLRDSLHAAAA